MHDKAPQVVLVLRAVEDPKTGEVNEALQVARLLLFASIDRAGLHHVTYPGRDGVEYLGLSADEMRLIKEADRLGVEMRLGRASQHPAIEMTRGGKMRWPRRGRIVDGAFVEDNENGELVTGKQFRDAAHKKPSVYFFGAEFEDFALDKLERFSANESNGMERHATPHLAHNQHSSPQVLSVPTDRDRQTTVHSARAPAIDPVDSAGAAHRRRRGGGHADGDQGRAEHGVADGSPEGEASRAGSV